VKGAGQLATTPGSATGEQCRGATRSISSRGAEGRNSGQLEEPSPAQPEDAGTGATRGWHQQAQSEGRAKKATSSSSAGGAEGCEIRGNSKIHCRQGRKIQKPGQPGGRIGRRDQRTRSGATRTSTKEAPKDTRRGNSKLSRRQNPKMQDAGQLATSSGGATGRAGPRGSSARRAEGCGNRGNSKLHRGHSLRNAESGATRRLSARLNGLMNGPSNL